LEREEEQVRRVEIRFLIEQQVQQICVQTRRHFVQKEVTEQLVLLELLGEQ